MKARLSSITAPTIGTHVHAGIQMTDWSMMREWQDAPKVTKVTNTGGLGKRIVCRTGSYQAESLADLLRQLGYSQSEVWGKTNKLEWAWHRINNAKFKRGEPVEFEGRTFIKESH